MDYNLHIRMFAHTEFERLYSTKGYLIIGVDEVGRGALAGPIGVGAVVFHPPKNEADFETLKSLKLKDSKLLNANQREKAAIVIGECALNTAISFVDVKIINEKGIVKAFEIAVRNAVKKVQENLAIDMPIFVLIDAFKVPYLDGIGQDRQLNIVKGDMQCVSIAAASIIAKVARDNLMLDLSKNHQKYQWQKNKGYGTRDHIEAIKNYGATPHHRQLFLRNILG